MVRGITGFLTTGTLGSLYVRLCTSKSTAELEGRGALDTRRTRARKDPAVLCGRGAVLLVAVCGRRRNSFSELMDSNPRLSLRWRLWLRVKRSSQEPLDPVDGCVLGGMVGRILSTTAIFLEGGEGGGWLLP